MHYLYQLYSKTGPNLILSAVPDFSAQQFIKEWLKKNRRVFDYRCPESL